MTFMSLVFGVEVRGELGGIFRFRHGPYPPPSLGAWGLMESDRAAGDDSAGSLTMVIEA